MFAFGQDVILTEGQPYLGNSAEAFHWPYRPRPLWSPAACPKCPALSGRSWKEGVALFNRSSTIGGANIILKFYIHIVSYGNYSFSLQMYKIVFRIKLDSGIAAYAEKPLTMWAYLTKIRSSHPQRLLLPVVTPNSLPLDWSRSPVS